MVRRRKRTPLEKDIIEGLVPPLALGGLAVGTIAIGGATQPLLPAGTPNPLIATGSALGAVTVPIAVIGAGGIAFKQLSRLNRKIKRGVI